MNEFNLITLLLCIIIGQLFLIMWHIISVYEKIKGKNEANEHKGAKSERV